MTLEEFTAQLNANTFWKEFTFSETRFFPRPKQQVELADGIVKIGSLALVFQLEERTEETLDPKTERQWFRRKVLGKAMDQIKASLRYLAENEKTDKATRLRLEVVTLKTSKRSSFSSLDSRYLRTAGRPNSTSRRPPALSTVAAHDYLGILDKLRVPDDVRLYFEYREAVLPRLREAGTVMEEPDIMVAFLSEKDLPEPESIGRLHAFVQDLDAFDLSNIMRDLEAHIVNPERSSDYYRIMEEFARVPRSVWREFKTRLVISLEARAFRFALPKTDCTFMVASMDPDWPVTGVDGTRMRTNAVVMFTRAAKYDLKTRVGVGLLISKDGEYFQLDWCVVDESWAANPKMEELLATTSLFGPTRERMVDSFLFLNANSEMEV
ncbi:hypothetical protein [Nitrobacter sp. TKz-YC02]|uniref:hypothetical protein n=1 Tax=Nitrobacter sp. TKz-YC02 TaxID=3398704 RepID=UPI003CE8088D